MYDEFSKDWNELFWTVVTKSMSKYNIICQFLDENVTPSIEIWYQIFLLTHNFLLCCGCDISYLTQLLQASVTFNTVSKFFVASQVVSRDQMLNNIIIFHKVYVPGTFPGLMSLATHIFVFYSLTIFENGVIYGCFKDLVDTIFNAIIGLCHDFLSSEQLL